jgi:nitrate/nitrite-specific signal transduction histidine kinase
MQEKNVLENRVEDRTRIISTMQAMTGFLNTCASIDEAGIVINRIMPALLPNISGAISIIKSSCNRLDVLLTWGRSWPGRHAFLPWECWALRRRNAHSSKSNNLYIPSDHMDETSNTQTLCIPLIAQGKTIGVLHAIGNEHELNEEDMKLVTSVFEQIGLALANIQLRDSLRKQAIRDPLTGLDNHRYMLESLDQTVSRSNRKQNSMAVFMLDVDHFKRSNDTFGHKAGDMILSNIAAK